MSNLRNSIFLLGAATLGVALGVGLCQFMAASHKATQQARISELEAQLAQHGQKRMEAIALAGPGVASSPIDQQVKDLSTRFVGDSRNLAEKLRDFTAEHTRAQDLAIACKVVADLAENPDAMGNGELIWLYGTQTNPDLKRVIAQVLSLRGDNQLLDAYIAPLGAGLADPHPGKRSTLLAELAKTRYAGAADRILALLDEALEAGNTSLLLDALLALRATGNESHIQPLEKLVNHPDTSVSWLATDARNNLELLSKKARLRLNSADISAELPPIPVE